MKKELLIWYNLGAKTKTNTIRRSPMNILKDTALECNPYLKINFDGGDLSSDAGLLLIKEFAEKIGLVKLIYRLFKTNDAATFRYHIDPENLLQMIYQTIAAYF